MAIPANRRDVFLHYGTVQLPGTFSELDAARMAERIWEVLESRYAMRRDDPATWTEHQPTGFQPLTRAMAFNSIASPPVITALNDILGVGQWNSTKSWGAPLVTFPETKRAWDIPKNQWHLDFPVTRNSTELPGVRILAFIAPVKPKCGGTVIAAGSHRLIEHLVSAGQVQDGHSATIRDTLAKSHAWFRSLWGDTGDVSDRQRRFVETTECVDGVDVRIEELTGEPGDAVLMHPWTFHAPAPNCGQTPRFMIAHSVYRRNA